jgi:maltooligosyltrehalose trehalohydrolase
MTDQHQARPASLGTSPLRDGRWQFAVWAPNHEEVELRLLGRTPGLQPMRRDALGYYTAIVDDAQPGDKYLYRLGKSTERPDPASRFQPDGVHGASQLVDVRAFEWTDSTWKGVALEDSIFYELHVGTFTPSGTFAAVIPCLDYLAELGVTTIELMPIAQFPGARNWGYDGVYPFAIQNSYGSPRDLQNLVNAAHSKGLGVALDVVYNHLGPEGNYLSEYGPYFTDRYRTPWGQALNFDGPYSDEVRHFFIQNATYWIESFHIDALRLDAIHGIYDASAIPFLAELSTEVASLSERLGRKIPLVAESDLNDARVLRTTADGGFGIDAQWSDDFHHSVHTLLTGEKSGYYADFGKICHLATTLQQGWYYAGQYSRYRKRKFGNKPPDGKPSRFVVCVQNHDQVGNRPAGERLSRVSTFESLKLAAGITILYQFVPLLFMGEEYGETAPFQYFTSHGDPDLAEAVRRGRKADFQSFDWNIEVPDPQAESTFAASKLNRELIQEEPHRTLLRFYQMLLRFRREHDLARLPQPSVVQHESPKAIYVVFKSAKSLAVIFHCGEAPATLNISLRRGMWTKRIDSADLTWMGPGSQISETFDGGENLELSLQPRSFAVFECTRPGLE